MALSPIQLQQDATNKALALNNQMLSPYVGAGVNALSGLAETAGQQNVGQEYFDNIAAMNPNVSVNYQQMVEDPQYQFLRDRNLEMMKRQLSGAGISGRPAMDAIFETGMNFDSAWDNKLYGRATDDYMRGYGQQGDLYNMANQGINNQYNRQMGLAGLGQNAATNLANSNSNLWTGMANAQASNILSQNALSAQQAQDQNNLWAGLAGTALNNVGGITKGFDWLGGTTGWW